MKRLRAQSSIQDRTKRSTVFLLKPCLVIGTGFHNWVLGSHRAQCVLQSWDKLNTCTAREMQVPLAETTCDRLALRWETLLLTAAANGYLSPKNGWIASAKVGKISGIEVHARLIVAGLISESQSTYPHQSNRARFPLDACWGSVVSLNFDTAWLTPSPPRGFLINANAGNFSKAATREDQRMTHFHQVKPSSDSPKRVWFPNGCVARGQSLRLGLREFGLQCAALNTAFNMAKRFETKASKNCNSPAQRLDEIRRILEALPNSTTGSTNNPFPLTWVMEILYRPVLFAGVGLHTDEVGLWWLMCQRARNLARVQDNCKPTAAILLRQDNRDLKFWRTNPLGIMPLICDDWNEGWKMAREWGTHHADCQGYTSAQRGGANT